MEYVNLDEITEGRPVLRPEPSETQVAHRAREIAEQGVGEALNVFRRKDGWLQTVDGTAILRALRELALSGDLDARTRRNGVPVVVAESEGEAQERAGAHVLRTSAGPVGEAISAQLVIREADLRSAQVSEQRDGRTRGQQQQPGLPRYLAETYGIGETKARRLVQRAQIPREVLDEWLTAENVTGQVLNKIGQRIYHEAPSDPAAFARWALATHQQQRPGEDEGSDTEVNDATDNADGPGTDTDPVGDTDNVPDDQDQPAAAGADAGEPEPATAGTRSTKRGDVAETLMSPEEVGREAARALGTANDHDLTRTLCTLVNEGDVAPEHLDAIWPYVKAAADHVPPDRVVSVLVETQDDDDQAEHLRTAMEHGERRPCEAFEAVVTHGWRPTPADLRDAKVAELGHEEPGQLRKMFRNLKPELTREQVDDIVTGIGRPRRRGHSGPGRQGTLAQPSEIYRVQRRIRYALQADHVDLTVDAIAKLSDRGVATVSEVRTYGGRIGKCQHNLDAIDRGLDRVRVPHDPREPGDRADDRTPALADTA